MNTPVDTVTSLVGTTTDSADMGTSPVDMVVTPAGTVTSPLDMITDAAGSVTSPLDVINDSADISASPSTIPTLEQYDFISSNMRCMSFTMTDVKLNKSVYGYYGTAMLRLGETSATSIPVQIIQGKISQQGGTDTLSEGTVTSTSLLSCLTSV